MINTTINPSNLLDYQVSHVQNLVDSLHLNGYAADLSDTGTGKTYSACGVARELNVPFLVICPKAMIPEWKKVCEFFGISPLGVVNYESLIRGTEKSKFTHWLNEDHPFKKSENGESAKIPKLRFNSNVPANSLIIFDEVHRCKSMTEAYSDAGSKNAKLLMTCREQGFKTLKVSASAATNPIEMQAFGYSCHMHSNQDHLDFRKNFCVGHGAYRGKSSMMFNPESQAARQGMTAINKYLFETKKCASRLRVKDLGKHFPEEKTMAQTLDMGKNTTKIQRAYDNMERELAELESKPHKDHIFSIIMRARRTSELCKVPVFVEQIESHIRDNKSVAVFLNFNDSIEAIKARLEKTYKKSNITVATVRGGQKDAERQQAIEDFQSDKVRILLCNIAAGGVGISLHDLNGKHARVSIISPSYSAIQLLQALGRVYRSGAKSKVLQQIIFAAGTIEEKACHRVQSRLHCLSMLNDGDMTDGINFLENVTDIDYEVAA